MTIHIHAEFKPYEESFDAVKRALAATVEAVRAEPGCLRYTLLGSRRSLVMVEEWADQVALDRHAAGENLTALMASLDGKLSERVAVRSLREVAAS